MDFIFLILNPESTGSSGSGPFNSQSLTSVSVLSFAVGPVLGGCLNLISPLTKQSLESAIKNNDFEKLVYRSATGMKPLLITLTTRKVYLGWAVRGPNPTSERKAIRIMPLASGYRDEHNQKVRFNTYYIKILEDILDTTNPNLAHMEAGDLEIVILWNQISSAHIFDPVAYEKFQIESYQGMFEESPIRQSENDVDTCPGGSEK